MSACLSDGQAAPAYGNDERPLQSGSIAFDNVSFAYREDRLVLQDITLDVPSRGFVALVGHTGSGKSTLASLLMGYYPVTHGEIRLDGRPLASLSHTVLRKGVAMVQQDPVVLADTFYANVTPGETTRRSRSGTCWKKCSWQSWRAGLAMGSIPNWASRGTISPSGKSSSGAGAGAD